MHNGFSIEDITKESPDDIVSQWTLSCCSKVLCIFIAICVTHFCTWGDYFPEDDTP